MSASDAKKDAEEERKRVPQWCRMATPPWWNSGSPDTGSCLFNPDPTDVCIYNCCSQSRDSRVGRFVDLDCCVASCYAKEVDEIDPKGELRALWHPYEYPENRPPISSLECAKRQKHVSAHGTRFMDWCDAFKDLPGGGGDWPSGPPNECLRRCCRVASYPEVAPSFDTDACLDWCLETEAKRRCKDYEECSDVSSAKARVANRVFSGRYFRWMHKRRMWAAKHK
jgi:hypothetical protein